MARFTGYFRAFVFALTVSATALVLSAVGTGLNARQIQSLTIFCGLIWGILLFENHRTLVAVCAGAAVIGLGLITLRQLPEKAGLDVVLFILGTYLVAGYLEEAFFFEHVAGQIVRRVGPRPGTLIGVLMLAAMGASAVVGEVAAILFVGGAMLNIAHRYKVRPIPFLIMLVFATNIGSAATAFGPVGVTLALKAHLTVIQFFRWATPVAVVTLGLVFLICRWWFKWDWELFEQAALDYHGNAALRDEKRGGPAWAGWLLTAGMIALFVFHGQIEKWTGQRPEIVLPAAALTAGGIGLLLSGRRAGKVIAHRVDWGTLVFFSMMFIIVAAMEETGVTVALARGLMSGTHGRPAELVLAVGWGTGLLSAILVNLLAVAAFLPIVSELNAHGAACPPAVYWLMLFGATFMGNMTSIGSTCNIIAVGMADKRGHGTIYFAPWLKVGLVVSLASMGLATLLLAIQTHWLTR